MRCPLVDTEQRGGGGSFFSSSALFKIYDKVPVLLIEPEILFILLLISDIILINFLYKLFFTFCDKEITYFNLQFQICSGKGIFKEVLCTIVILTVITKINIYILITCSFF